MAAEIDRIVAASVPRNAALEVTGALVFTGVRFAQYLEGPPTAVEELRASILRDPRHRAITTLMHGPAGERHFADWSLAYRGCSMFIATMIDVAVDEVRGGGHAAADRLLEMLREFVKTGDETAASGRSPERAGS